MKTQLPSFVCRFSRHPIVCFCITLATINIGTNPVAGEDTPVEVDHVNALSRAFRGAVEIASPSVVRVVGRVRLATARRIGRSPSLMDKASTEVETHEEFQDISIGSGIVLQANGLILTNSHVLDHAEQVIIRLRDRREYEASKIRRDPKSDLAIMHIENSPLLQPAMLGDSDLLETGDWVLAIGSPFELDATVSAGIISGKGRGIQRIERGKMLQTDAAINPGNSGGPLVGLNGKVVGINTAIASSSGGYQGIGFAIPINHAKWVITQLREHGHVKRAALGVKITDVTPKIARQWGIPFNTGVVIRQVISNSAADLAGLKVDDIILEFAGTPVGDTRELQTLVERKPAGSEQQLRLLREGEELIHIINVGLLDD